MPEYSGCGDIDYFNIITKLGNFLNDNLVDVRKDRNNKRWIFPTFPDSDSNYPEIVINVKGIKYNENSAGRFLFEENDSSGNLKKYYSLDGVADISIYVLTEKNSQFNTTRNGKTLYLRNQPLNEFITNNIRDIFKWKRYEFLDDDFIYDVRLTGISEVFDDGPNTWACEINTSIVIRDIWVEEYSASNELISSYSLNMNVTT